MAKAIAVSGAARPSVLSVRLFSGNVDQVNAVLARELPALEGPVRQGVIATIEEERVRFRRLPIE